MYAQRIEIIAQYMPHPSYKNKHPLVLLLYNICLNHVLDFRFCQVFLPLFSLIQLVLYISLRFVFLSYQFFSHYTICTCFCVQFKYQLFFRNFIECSIYILFFILSCSMAFYIQKAMVVTTILVLFPASLQILGISIHFSFPKFFV